ncbi:MAG: nitrate reductase associated protein [Sandaracinaceae bacterium]
MSDVREAIRAFVAEREWEPFHDPKNLAMAVASEAGELCGELRWVASDEADAFASRPEVRARLEDEAADVAVCLFMFCDRVGIDLDAAIGRKLLKNAEKYPVPQPPEGPTKKARHQGLLPGEDDLEYIPMAVRRGLDRAGLRISLATWTSLRPALREALLGEGMRPAIDTDALRRLLEGTETVPTDATPDPDGLPHALSHVLDAAAWAGIGPVERHALDSYARRNKEAKLKALLAALGLG